MVHPSWVAIHVSMLMCHVSDFNNHNILWDNIIGLQFGLNYSAFTACGVFKLHLLTRPSGNLANLTILKALDFIMVRWHYNFDYMWHFHVSFCSDLGSSCSMKEIILFIWYILKDIPALHSQKRFLYPLFVLIHGIGSRAVSAHTFKDFPQVRMLGTFNQHLPMILSNNYWCQSKPTSLLDAKTNAFYFVQIGRP